MRTATAARTLRVGWPSPLTLPGYTDETGTSIRYEALTARERALLVVALADYGATVARLVDARLALLVPPDVRIIRVVVK